MNSVNLVSSLDFECYFSPVMERKNVIQKAKETGSTPSFTVKEVFLELFSVEHADSMQFVTSSLPTETDEKVSQISQQSGVSIQSEILPAEELSLYPEIPLKILEQETQAHRVEEISKKTETRQEAKKTRVPTARHKIAKASIRDKWTKEDDEILLTALRRNMGINKKKNWNAVSDDLNNKFSDKACLRRFERKWKRLEMDSQIWSVKGPIEIISDYRNHQVQSIPFVANVSQYQVLIKNHDSSSKSKKWTKEEDRLLREGIQLFGTHWVTIYRVQGFYEFSRTPDDCQKRYQTSISKERKI